jgi:hypothetical protein
MAGAAQHLKSNGLLYLYGPFMIDGLHTAQSNASFDQYLRAENPKWGLRAMESVVKEAQQHQLTHIQTVAMPANNFSLLFRC